MTESTSTELDPREELASLVASTRALLEQYEASGALALAADPATATAFLAGAPLPPPRESPAASHPTRATSPAAAAPAPPARATPPPADVTPPRVTPPAQEAFAPPARMSPPARPAAPAPADPPARAAAPAARAATPAREIAAPPAPEIGAVDERDDRRMRLALIADAVRSCTKCVLCETRTQTVFSRGDPFAELCFVGEGPGEDEDAQGEPFVGKAGQLLDRMIAAMGYRRGDVYICNIVKCRPPSNRKPEPAEMDACMPYLRDQIALVRPRVIVALGATAYSGLTGSTEGITRARGKWKLFRGTIPMMPTFHPSYLLRDPTKKREAWNDLQEVMKHLGKAAPRSGSDDRGRGDE